MDTMPLHYKKDKKITETGIQSQVIQNATGILDNVYMSFVHRDEKDPQWFPSYSNSIPWLSAKWLD